ncbi:MAG: hypothetical protein ACRDBR_00740 [Metamycoplasmataceae bacterium]
MKYYCSYDKKLDPYFWKLKKVNDNPHVFFKNRQDAINYYLSQKHEGVIWFQKDKNDLARGFVPKYEGYINSTRENNKLIHEIKLFDSVKLLNPEETIRKLYSTWNLNQETGEDILALNKIDRSRTILNSYLTSSQMRSFLESKKRRKTKKEKIVAPQEELNFDEVPSLEEWKGSSSEFDSVNDNFLNFYELDNIIYNNYKNNKGQNMNMKKKIYQPVGYIIPPNQTGTIEYTVVPGQTLNTAINPLGQETMIVSSPPPQYNYNYVEAIPQPIYVAPPQPMIQPMPQPIQVVQAPSPYSSYYSTNNYDYPSFAPQQQQSNIVESLTNEIKHMRNDLSQIQSKTQSLSFSRPETINPLAITSEINNSVENFKNEIKRELQSFSRPDPINSLAITSEINNSVENFKNEIKREIQSFSRPDPINSLAITSEINNSVENFKNEIKREIHDEFSYLSSQFNFADMGQTDRKISDLKANLKDIQENLRALLENQKLSYNTINNDHYNDIANIKQELQNLNTTILNTTSSQNNTFFNDLNQIKNKIRDLSDKAGNVDTSEFGSDLKSIRNEIQTLKGDLYSAKTQTASIPAPRTSTAPTSSTVSPTISPVVSPPVRTTTTTLIPDFKPQEPAVKPKSKKEAKLEAKLKAKEAKLEAKLETKETKLEAKQAKNTKEKMPKKTKVGLGFLFTFTGLLFVGAITIVVLFFLGII